MNILYLRPYPGEKKIVKDQISDQTIIFAESIEELDMVTRTEIKILSIFVDQEISKETLDLLPNLELIATRSTGYDHIDLTIAKERDIVVCSVPHYGTRTVAEYAIALMFALSRNAYRSYVDMQHDVTAAHLERYQGFDLYGKTLGVVGTGAIGRQVCEIAGGIGMKVVAFDVHPDESFAKTNNVTYRPLDDLLSNADIVTIHVPAIPATEHMINKETLGKMKSGSYLINTARGSIVDTKALVQALQDKHLAGAALDVLEGEFDLREEAQLFNQPSIDSSVWQTLVADHALINMPNVIVTPHIAFNTVEAKREITDTTVRNILDFINQEPSNLVRT